MKKLFSIMAIAAVVALGTFTAKANNAQTTLPVQVQQIVASVDAGTTITTIQEEELSFTQDLKKRFIEGGPGFMGIVLLCLILGLAIAIERIIYLNLATTNTKKLAQNVEDALNSGGVEAAKEVCRNTKGPVASIYYQGLDRVGEGVEAAEKAVVSYGGVQMGQLEKNVSWLSLFIALAPMLGFMGTVIGMIQAFDKIEAAGDMNPALVAGGIKVALLTTVFGLVVAIILQIFYNYIIAKIDSIVNDTLKTLKIMGLHKILKIIVAVLGIVALIFAGIVWTLDGEGLKEELKLVGISKMEIPSSINNLMLIAYIVLGLILILLIIFVLKGLFSGNAKNTLIGVGAFLFVIAISYFTASGVETPMKDGEVLSANGAKWIGAGINAFYILAITAIGLMLFSGAKKLVK